MRKIIAITTILLLAATGLDAQHYIGIKGGYGAGTARFFPKEETGYEGGLKSGGVSWKFFTETKYVGGVQVDLEYLERGFNYSLFKDSDTSYHRTLRSVSLPLIWQPHAYLFSRNARVFLNLGIAFSYNMDSKYRVQRVESGEVIEQGKYPMITVRDNKLGYGLLGGVGIGFFINRFEVALEGRYYFGYADIRKNRTKYSMDADKMRPWDRNPLRTPLDNINISAAVYYRLGKGDIRSAPSKRTALRMMEAGQKRNLKKARKNDNGERIDTTTENSPPDTAGHE